ncbi:hypothetical protein, partial [Escherichia coli]|uniref:hypothetical protein n=1 Tax=Escherichia coli TaxID=562 RepID=UPI001BD6D679
MFQRAPAIAATAGPSPFETPLRGSSGWRVENCAYGSSSIRLHIVLGDDRIRIKTLVGETLLL